MINIVLNINASTKKVTNVSCYDTEIEAPAIVPDFVNKWMIQANDGVKFQVERDSFTTAIQVFNQYSPDYYVDIIWEK